MDDYTRQILRVAVAQICQTIGWHTIQSTPLELLTDILHKYLQELSRETHRYTELYGRTDANLDDVALAFHDLSINIPDLQEYVNNVDSVPCAIEVPKYPVHKESSLNFLKPGSKEVVTRPVHVHEYLPAIYPEKEIDETTANAGGGAGAGAAGENNGLEGSVGPPVGAHSLCANSSNPSSSNGCLENNNNHIPPNDSIASTTTCENELFKKPEINEIAIVKKSRILHEDEGRPTREISSVMMTSSGFISPAREGKLPDTKIPIIPETKPIIRPNTPPQQQTTTVASLSSSSSIQTVVPPPPVTESSLLSPASVPSRNTNHPEATANKIEKKGKRQRQSQSVASSSNATSNLQAKEQRKRDRQLAKLQKLNAASGGGAGTSSSCLPIPATGATRKAASSGKKQKMKHFKMKYEASLAAAAANAQAIPAPLPPPPPLLPSQPPPPPLPLQQPEMISSHSSGHLPPPPALMPVILPADLTIRQETVPIVAPTLPTMPIYPPPLSSSVSYDPGSIYHAGPSGLGIEKYHQRNVADIKLTNEPDRQKSHIFKKISKRSRDDDQHHHHTSHHHLHHHHHGTKQTVTGRDHNSSVYSGLPSLPESTTIRAIPSVIKSDPNVIIVDDDPSPQLLPPLSALQMFQPPPPQQKLITTKPARKQRIKKDVLRRVLLDQTAPLNLSSETTPSINPPPPKPARKTKSKAEKSSSNKRGAPIQAYSEIAAEQQPSGPIPSTSSGGLLPDDLSPLNMMPPGMPPYPGMMLYQFPPLIPRPGLIPTNNPLLQFRNPFAYNDFMSLSLRPPLRINEPRTPSPPPPPLDLDSSVYCNVAPLVPDSLKFQLAAKAAGLTKSITASSSAYLSTTTTTHTVTSGSLEAANKSSSSAAIRPQQQAPLDAPIEISDDEKVKSDPEPDRTSNDDEDGGSSQPTKPIRSINTTDHHHHSKMTVDNDDDDFGDAAAAGGPSETRGDTPDRHQSVAIPGTSSGAKSEKKRDKEHKRGKRGKDGKLKKKKDKKDKSRSKERAEKRKEEKKEKSKKQKKEKRKEKLRAMSYNSGSDTKPAADAQHDQHPSSSSVPKLTLKFSSPRGGDGDSSDGRKIKLVTIGGGSGVCDDDSNDEIGPDERRESSPELARISPLVTRPPKQKSSTKDKNSDTEQSPVNVATTSGGGSGSAIASASVGGGGGVSGGSSTVPPLVVIPARGPGRPPKNSNAGAGSGSVGGVGGAPISGPSTQTHHQQLQHSISSNTVSSTTSSLLSATSPLIVASTSSTAAGRTTTLPAASVVTSSTAAQSVVDSTDAEGNQVWICPACGRVDDGTPMIGCDGCDAWYHWVCVGIQVPPDEREDWYCRVCIARKQEANGSDKKKKRKKKNKTN